ncbi:MAG: hypothetical protein A2991_00745 [Candidatus Terrybacteria bacterium RIFCSPLOWO2_01_FULL_58_14]|uniref:Secondary thiamine-phosphate synthase enzyme n=1 Tax=Candidatus Terrybacteria bacterium RIFCSPLOWO2_01_FULL_58_14 TaxID=1802369 RepID=A0A1G2Q054_9BACT|nr:MAG: hypothetical protein A2991_00745 [Candidatus Terrybacteria bacterium RIFCSPLOWO2_01_FULL_58_14]
MATITLHTVREKQVLDITPDVEKFLAGQDAREGICHLFLTHTTAALTTADLDPGTDLDTLDAFAALVPKLQYRHPHDPAHMPDHILSTLIGASLALPVRSGKPVLGEWQRIVLVEFAGPREREIACSWISENCGVRESAGT